MSLETQYAVAIDAVFKKRIEIAICKAALAVQAELASVEKHTERSQLAFDVLRDPPGFADIFAKAAVTNSVITGASADGDIEFQVNSMWTAFALRP